MLFDLSKSFDENKSDAYYQKLKKDKAKIELKKRGEKRSIDQNSYLHVCLHLYSIETGYDVEELKTIFSLELPELLIYEKNGYKFRRSTSKLSVEEMSKLINYIRKHANDNIGLYIPTSEEYLINQFQVERDIQNGR